MRKITITMLLLGMVSCGVLDNLQEAEKHDFPGGEGCTLKVFDRFSWTTTIYMHTSIDEFIYEHPGQSFIRYKFTEKCN